MADGSGTQNNPLSRDPVLFDMFMAAVDEVVAEPEIRGALEEFRLTPQNLRHRMVTAAEQVLNAAPLEFAAYKAARDDVRGDLATGVAIRPVLDVLRLLGLAVSQASDGTVRIQRWIGRGLAASSTSSRSRFPPSPIRSPHCAANSPHTLTTASPCRTSSPIGSIPRG